MPFVTAYANDAGRNEPGGVLRPFRAGGKFVVVRGYAPPGGRSPARSGAPGHALSRSWLRRGLQRARPGAALPMAGFPLRLLPRCPGLQRATRLAAADISALPYAADSFDCVTCFDVLVMFGPERIGGALQEFHRVLRPGGLLVVRVAALEWLRGRHSYLNAEARRYRS